MSRAAKDRQLPLDLQYRPALEREVFLVAPGNATAIGWIDRWPDWPAPALVLEGPRGSGKTHLASVWRARSGAWVVEGASLSPSQVPVLLSHAAAVGVVEGAEHAPDEPLLHLYNAVAERGGQLLLTAASAPAQWATALPDLRSRLRALPVASLAMPDDLLFKAVLTKLFADRRLNVGADVIDFLTIRLERSFEAAGDIVAALDRAAFAERRRITVPFVRAVLMAAAVS